LGQHVAQKLRRLKDLFRQVFPEKLAPSDNVALAHRKQLQREPLSFAVVTKDVDVAFRSRGHLLLLGQTDHRSAQIAILGRQLITQIVGSFQHASFERIGEFLISSFEQQPYVAQPQGGPYASTPTTYEPPYTLDSGDKLRIVVFGQDGISNSYTVDAGGNVNLPLVGIVPARGFATQQLAHMIAERLKQGYVREPHVSVEIEAYRPFFILGEVTNPGQYPYVANMTAETAIAIAGGFAPRANKSTVKLTRNAPGQQINGEVPLGYPLRPGDTIVVKERWF